jgi:hypothetical protein
MKLLAVLTALLLVAAACGGGDDSSLSDTEQALADAIALQLLDDDDGLASVEEAQCYGEGVVSEMGVERLIEVGLDEAAVESGTSPADVELSPEEVDALLEPMIDCIDFTGVFVDGLTSGSDGVSEDSADCIADGISDDTIRSAAEAGITGEEFDPASNQQMMGEIIDLMTECLTPEEFEAITSG